MKGFWLYPKSRSHDPTTVPHSPSAPSLGSWTQLVLDVRMLTGCDQQGPWTRGWGEARPARKAEGEPEGSLLLLRNASLPLLGHHAHPDQLCILCPSFHSELWDSFCRCTRQRLGSNIPHRLSPPPSPSPALQLRPAAAYTPAPCLRSGVQPPALAFTAA